MWAFRTPTPLHGMRPHPQIHHGPFFAVSADMRVLQVEHSACTCMHDGKHEDPSRMHACVPCSSMPLNGFPAIHEHEFLSIFDVALTFCLPFHVPSDPPIPMRYTRLKPSWTCQPLTRRCCRRFQTRVFRLPWTTESRSSCRRWTRLRPTKRGQQSWRPRPTDVSWLREVPTDLFVFGWCTKPRQDLKSTFIKWFNTESEASNRRLWFVYNRSLGEASRSLYFFAIHISQKTKRHKQHQVFGEHHPSDIRYFDVYMPWRSSFYQHNLPPAQRQEVPYPAL